MKRLVEWLWDVIGTVLLILIIVLFKLPALFQWICSQLFS